MSLISKAYSYLNVKVDNLIEKARKETVGPQRKSVDLDPNLPEGTGSGYREKHSMVTLETLQRVSRKNSVIAAIIQTRLNQIASFSRPQKDKYSLGFKVKLKDHKKEPSKTEENEMKFLEDFFANTGVIDDTRNIEIRDNFETFLRKIIRDRLITDQIAIEIVPTKNGKVHHFVPVSAGTIKYTSKNFQKIVKQGGLNKLSRDNISENVKSKVEEGKQYRYAQVYQDRVLDVFTEDELIFKMANPVNDLDANGYSIGELELLIQVITAHLHAENYNKLAFTHGQAQKGILHIKGDYSARQLNAFKRHWYNQVTGNANSFRTPIMAGMDEVKWISLQSTNREMEYHQWIQYLVKIICAIYQIDPMEINFDISRSGGGEGSVGGASHRNEERVQISKDRGLRPILRFLENIINDEILRRMSDKYVFEFVGLNAETVEQEQERQKREIETFKTINEIRKENDLDELDYEKIKDNPGDWILSPTFVSIMGSIAGGGQQDEGDDEEFNVDDLDDDEQNVDDTEKSFTKAKKYTKIKV